MRTLRAGALLVVGLIAFPPAASAQTDEIQVYDAEVMPPGKVNLMLHANFTPIGLKSAAFLGGIIPDNSVNATLEWAFGVKPWFEQGLYLPVFTPYSKGRGATVDGFKLRELFVRPNAQNHKFFYGVNFEFSVNAHYWESQRISSEIRPIVGTHLGKWDLIYNPIVDTDYRGGFGGLEFAPAGRVAYNLNKNWAAAVEEYADFGPLHQFYGTDDQAHSIWAVVNHHTRRVDIETGVGVGVTAGADKLTFKLMLSRDLN